MYFHPGAHERILSAGLELFSRRGFENTTVPQIAKYARVGLNTFYKYFRNKEELLNQIYRELRRLLAAVLDRTPGHGESPRHQFQELWQEMIHFDREHPDVVGFLEHRHHGAYLDETSRPLERVPQPIVDLVERLQREHAIRQNVAPAILAAIVWGTFVELVKLDSQGRLSLTPSRLEGAEECIWDAIRAAERDEKTTRDAATH